jgi:hypothetical protein
MVIVVDKSVDIVARQFEVSRFILGDIPKRRQSGMGLLIPHFSHFIRQEVALIVIHFSRHFLPETHQLEHLATPLAPLHAALPQHEV